MHQGRVSQNCSHCISSWGLSKPIASLSDPEPGQSDHSRLHSATSAGGDSSGQLLHIEGLERTPDLRLGEEHRWASNFTREANCAGAQLESMIPCLC